MQLAALPLNRGRHHGSTRQGPWRERLHGSVQIQLEHDQIVPLAKQVMDVLEPTPLPGPRPGPKRGLPLERVSELFDRDSHAVQVVGDVQPTKTGQPLGQSPGPAPTACHSGLAELADSHRLLEHLHGLREPVTCPRGQCFVEHPRALGERGAAQAREIRIESRSRGS